MKYPNEPVGPFRTRREPVITSAMAPNQNEPPSIAERSKGVAR